MNNRDNSDADDHEQSITDDDQIPVSAFVFIGFSVRTDHHVCPEWVPCEHESHEEALSTDDALLIFI